MKTNRKTTNPKKLRRAAKDVLSQKLTAEQVTRLRQYAESVGAIGTSFGIANMHDGITLAEAEVFLALADMEIAQRRGPDYSD